MMRKIKMYISEINLQVAWLMFKEFLAKVFGSRPEFYLAPSYQEGWVK